MTRAAIAAAIALLVGAVVGAGAAIGFGWVTGLTVSPQIGPVYLSPPVPQVRLGPTFNGTMGVGERVMENLSLDAEGLHGVELRLSWIDPPGLRYRFSLNVTPPEGLGGPIVAAGESGNLSVAVATVNATGAPLLLGVSHWSVVVSAEAARLDGPPQAPGATPPDEVLEAEWRADTALVPVGAAFSSLPHALGLGLPAVGGAGNDFAAAPGGGGTALLLGSVVALGFAGIYGWRRWRGGKMRP